MNFIGDIINFQLKKDYDAQVRGINSFVKGKSDIYIKPLTFGSQC